jgi:hypothetical protein
MQPSAWVESWDDIEAFGKAKTEFLRVIYACDK